MPKFIDDFLNTTTMYRLVLYYLLLLVCVALGFSFFGILPYAPIALIVSTIFIVAVSVITNTIFSRVFNAPANIESVYISALILVLIITPPQISDYQTFLSLALWASVWAMASKYIIAIGKRHIFNPVAFAVALTALTINQSASWWGGGNLPMLPFIILGGILIVTKIRRFDMVASFFVVALVTIMIPNLLNGTNPFVSIWKGMTHYPLFFFAFIMLTEPITTPPNRIRRLLYGAFIGFLSAPFIHIGSIYSTPELALLVGNIFSYSVSPKLKFIPQLVEKKKIANDTWEFLFSSGKRPWFQPGQYMEWMLPHEKTDSRGNRRYFTLASSPTEQKINLGAKFYPNPSSFKEALAGMNEGDTIILARLAGDFVMPRNPKKKLVFIAGGIGVTPFRSMVKYLIDTKEKRNIVLLYSNKTVADIAYKDVFDQAEQQLGIKTIYAVEDEKATPPSWQGYHGRINTQIIADEIPDYRERIFYLSGPHSMVNAFEKTLNEMGIKKSRIKTDFFPGFV